MYAPPGEVEGELVFCDAGTEQDLQLLDSMNITVKDRIVLLKGHSSSVSSSEVTEGSNIEHFSFEKHFKRKNARYNMTFQCHVVAIIKGRLK